MLPFSVRCITFQMKTEVKEEGLSTATSLSYPLFENSKKNDSAPADKVDSTLIINQRLRRRSCGQFLLTLSRKLSSMSDFNQSFTLFEQLVNLIAPCGLEAFRKLGSICLCITMLV